MSFARNGKLRLKILVTITGMSVLAVTSLGHMSWQFMVADRTFMSFVHAETKANKHIVAVIRHPQFIAHRAYQVTAGDLHLADRTFHNLGGAFNA